MKRQHSLPGLNIRTNTSKSLFSSKKTNILQRLGFQELKWFQKRGKSDSILFNSSSIKKMRKYFNDLDIDSSGAIGLEQLQDPLITLQFCQSRNQVQNLINTIDLDGSGEVQFNQFLQIFRKFKINKYASPQQAEKYKSFMNMFSQKTSNKLQGLNNFRLAISELRRKKMIKQITVKNQVSPVLAQTKNSQSYLMSIKRNNIVPQRLFTKKQSYIKEYQNNELIKPSKKYSRKRDHIPKYLRKIQNMFIQIPQLNKKIQQNKKKDYYRFKLGRS